MTLFIPFFRLNDYISSHSQKYHLLLFSFLPPQINKTFFALLISEDNRLHTQPSNPHPPAGLHTRNCACSHCTSTSPSGFMCKPPHPRKDHLLQSWCPYNPLPPDAASAGRNLCSNPSRATR